MRWAGVLCQKNSETLSVQRERRWWAVWFHGNNGDIFDFLFIWPKFAVVVGIVLLLGSDCLLRRTVDVEPAGVMTRAIIGYLR